MYVRLGNTSIKYQDPDYDDFMIFCQVPTTQMSYKNPILVRTKNELDIWFGQQFPGRDYLDELVSAENTLYLYKPISVEPDRTIPGFIDYYNWPLSEFVYATMLGELEPKKGIIYQVVEDSGVYSNNTGLRWNKYIWAEGDLVDIRLLPQNLDHINSTSHQNQDTLRICWPGVRENITYCYPRPWETDEHEVSVLRGLDKIDLEKINKGFQTLAFKVGGITTALPREDSYVILTNEFGTGKIFYFGKDIPQDIKEQNEAAGNRGKNYYNPSTAQHVDSIMELLEKAEEMGYHWNPSQNLLTADYPVPVTYFYRVPGFSLEPDLTETHNLLDVLTRPWARVEFKSKTIGPGGPDGNIKVKIEKLNQDYYRFIISRFDYAEIFEGPTIDSNPGGEERLDYQVSRDSKLVECSLIETWTNEQGETVRYEGSSRGTDLGVGEWELRRAVTETYEEESYRAALKELLQPVGEPVLPDYILIPDLDLYGGSFIETLLGYCQEVNCQALIENTEDNYTWNLKDEPTNRLIYFWKGIEVNGNMRPGYYMYLLGLMADIYSLSGKNILYYGPVTSSSSVNPYITDARELEKYKCNYLIDNGQKYYYKTYQDGPNPETSGWMRFAVSKISRELEKNKWEYLSKKMVGSLRSSIMGVLERVKSSFSIIRDITVDEFELDQLHNKIYLRITTKVADLVKKDLTVDIVINYNKYNNYGSS